MGLMDAFGAETRVEITVRELTALLDGKAKTEADFNAAMVMLREGVEPDVVRAVFGLEKEKEPTTAATAADSKENIVQVQDNIKSVESQALRGVEVIGLMRGMILDIERNFEDNVEVMSLRADNGTASIVFRYGGTAYDLSFGLAF